MLAIEGQRVRMPVAARRPFWAMSTAVLESMASSLSWDQILSLVEKAADGDGDAVNGDTRNQRDGAGPAGGLRHL